MEKEIKNENYESAATNRFKMFDALSEGIILPEKLAESILKYLSTDEIEEFKRLNGYDDDEDLYDLMTVLSEKGLEDLADNLLRFLSDDEVREMAVMNEYDYLLDDEDEDDEDIDESVKLDLEMLLESKDDISFIVTGFGFNDEPEQFTDVDVERVEENDIHAAKEAAEKMLRRLNKYYSKSYVAIEDQNGEEVERISNDQE